MKRAGKIVGAAALAVAFLTLGCSYLETHISSGTAVGPDSRPYALDPKTIMAGDLNVTYLEAGQGKDVILLHGGVIPMNMYQSAMSGPMRRQVLQSGALTASETWNYNINELAENFHVLAMDLPGFGGSDKPQMNYELDEFVTYLDEFIQAKGLQSVSIVGHGLGGKVALGYAIKHGDNVENLVAVDSFGAHAGITLASEPIPRGVSSFWQREKAARMNITLPLKKRVLKNLGSVLPDVTRYAMHKKVKNAAPETIYNVFLTDQGNAGEFIAAEASYHAEYIGSAESKAETHANFQALIEARRQNIRDNLKKITAPTLIIHGFYDPVVTADEAEYMDQLIPESRLVTYAKSGHYPMIEESEKFNSEVGEFISTSDLGTAEDEAAEASEKFDEMIEASDAPPMEEEEATEEEWP